MNNPASCRPWRPRLWTRWWAAAAIVGVVLGVASRAESFPICTDGCVRQCLLRCVLPAPQCRNQCFRRCCFPGPKFSLGQIFRSADSEVESFNFSDPAHPKQVDHQAATPASPPGCPPGTECFNAASPSLAVDTQHLVRTTSADVQVFTVTADGHMTLLAGTPAQPSLTGLAIALGHATIFRAIDTGLQSFQLSGNTLGQPHFTAGTVSAAGVGLDVSDTVSNTVVAVRAHPTGIDASDVTNPTNMQLLGSNTTGAVSLTGVDVKIFANGTRAVRAESSGIEVYDLSQPATPRLLDMNNSGTPSLAGVAIVVDVAGTHAIRVTPHGIEVYDLTRGGFPRIDNCNSSNGNCNSMASTTGVGAGISAGNTIYRGLTSGVEAFSLANPASPVRLSSIPAVPAFAGVGLTSR
jgi:hypothetical protein